MAKLYIVPTPIGNLDDITLRAVNVLRTVDFILAEDTRTTSFLLKHLGIEKKLRSHHKFNEHATVELVAGEIAAGRDAALVSDAGTPGISDPGFLLVRTCVGAGIEVFRMLSESDALHDRLTANVERFRGRMLAAGFDIKPTQSAICAVMLYDAKLSQDFAARLLDEGIYVTGFYYPVVPKDQARIRVQVSAGHTEQELDRCVDAFVKVGRELGVLR